MPRTRRSVKAWSSKKAAGARQYRTYKRSTGTTRSKTAALIRPRKIGRASIKHEFLRWAPAIYVTDVPTGGLPTIAVTADSGGTSIPLSVTGGSSAMAYGSNMEFGASLEFKITDIPGIADFTNLFDHYKITQVDVEVDFLKNSALVKENGAVPPNNNAAMPSVMYAPDFDDAAVPTNSAMLSQRQRTKTWTFRGDGQPLKFSIQPKLSSLVYKESGTTIGYAAAGGDPAINLQYTDVPHYGYKLWFQDCPYNNATGQTTNFRVKMRYHLQMLDPQ